MPRLPLTDEPWSKLKAMMLEADIYNKSNLCMTLVGVLHACQVGCPRCDLRTEFDRWNSVFKQCNKWSKKGKLWLFLRYLLMFPIMNVLLSMVQLSRLISRVRERVTNQRQPLESPSQETLQKFMRLSMHLDCRLTLK
jgi:hypothetical protein